MKSKLPSFSCSKTGCRPPLKTKTALTLDSSPPLLAFDHDMTSAQKGKKGWKRRPFNVCNCRSIARSYCHPPVLPFCHTLFMGPPSRMWRKSNHWLTCAASKTFKKSKNLRYQSWKKNLLQMNTEYKKSKQTRNFLSSFIISCKKMKRKPNESLIRRPRQSSQNKGILSCCSARETK